MAIAADSRVILVGESNPISSDPEYALFCYPIGCAGYRLRRILGLPQHQYLALHRTNLCVGDWSMARARQRALELLDPQAPWHVMVLLGRKVAEVFNIGLVPFTSHVHFCPDRTLIYIPHPSGRNPVYNQPWAPKRARALLREFAPEVPWGTANDAAFADEPPTEASAS